MLLLKNGLEYKEVIERNGKLYSHVINPQLGRLLELNQTTLAQAVVVTKSCMVSDALATAVISKGDPAQARSMLDQFRTGYKVPVRDWILYARQGPRIIRLSIPGIESKSDRERRLQRHESATVIVGKYKILVTVLLRCSFDICYLLMVLP